MSIVRIKKIFFTLVAVIVISLGLAGYFAYQWYTAEKNPQAAAKEEVTELVEHVSKFILLPEGETPTVATVSDPDALKDQPFFAQAKKGDKVLIYAQSKKAILYSVLHDKILEVAPLNADIKKNQ